MTEEQSKNRTKQFALRVIKLSSSLPRSREGEVLGRQILRSGTSVEANYRSACRARSTPDFISKLGIVLEEAGETLYWLEIITESNLVPAKRLSSLMREADELVAIFVASVVTSKNNNRKPIKNQ
ncbi:MAG: four helix bundle protein [Bacteroidota bacterium]